MYIISIFYKIIIDALFPVSKAEQELFLLQPEQVFDKLPPAPAFTGLAIPVKDAKNMKSIFAYKDERVTKLVWNIKYKKSAHAVRIGGYALWWRLRRATPALIIPIPITNRRRKERGFNQCELLVDEIERLDVSKQFKIEKNLLTRVHHSSRQTLKSRPSRVEGAKGIFTVLSRVDLDRSITIIIIDDVITTGSTINEAIETMKKVGFENVYGLSLAH